MKKHNKQKKEKELDDIADQIARLCLERQNATPEDTRLLEIINKNLTALYLKKFNLLKGV